MTETTITVRGVHSAEYPAERAELSLAVAFDGPERAEVFELAVAGAQIVRSRIDESVDRHAGPIVSFTSDRVEIWAEKPWNQDGAVLPPVFHARIGFAVRFSDFAELDRFVEDLSTVAGVAVDAITWSLTDGTRLAALDEARSRAVHDAVAKADVLAQSIGLAAVRAVALADEGMLSDSPVAPGAPGALRMARAAKYAGPELSLRPDTIEVSAVVNARFVAT